MFIFFNRCRAPVKGRSGWRYLLGGVQKRRLLSPEWRPLVTGGSAPKRSLIALCKIGRATIKKSTNRLHMFKKVETSMMRKTINPQIQEAQ